MNTFDPVIADIIGLLGFDRLWLCNEHTGMDWDRMGHLIRSAAMNGMDTMIRASKGGYTGQATRFQPTGRRALDSGNSGGLYCRIPLHDYLRLANENTFLCVQVEDPEVLDRIRDVAGACARHGKHWGLPVSFESAPKYLEMGARFLSCGAGVLDLGFEFSPKL